MWVQYLPQQFCTHFINSSGVATMGLDWEYPGGPNPNGPPGSDCRVKTLARASDHQNSVKSLPKVLEMAFQRL